jgi:nifR3 family TIM-barrel protein
MRIGKLDLKNNLIAAPLAGYSDRVWRRIVHECGAGLAFSEMAAVEGLIRAHKKTEHYLLNFDDARPFGVQLFGANPESFERVFETLARYKIDAVDINAGCPVKKVVGRGAGAALMKTPKTIEAILAACRRSYHGPLTLKIRSGWDEKSVNAVEVARLAEACGVDAIIVHGRTKLQGFTGTADLGVIKDVVRSVGIPVIGNGDVKDIDSAKRMFDETGCAGVMIGRAALFNPLVFREISEGRPAATDEKLRVMFRHFELAAEHLDGRAAINTVKKFTPKYLRGLPDHREIVKRACQSRSAREALEGLKESF